jgi:hypothetical protein
MKTMKLAVLLALTVSAAFAQVPPPQGRLTLQSDTPVMTSDESNVTSVYYTPYIGDQIPIYSGTSFANNTFSQLTMTLNTSNQLSGDVYDLFVFLHSSVVTIGAGPAWSSTTSRGTGAGTTQLTQLDGLWVNANSITLTNGSTSYSSITADEATYVGSIYMTANGETSMQVRPAAAAGGVANVLGVWNAYNRVKVTAYNRDDTSNWSYSTASWRAADNSTSNKISFLDGLQQSLVTGNYSVLVTTAPDTVGGYIGLNIDSSTTTPDIAAGASSAAGQTSSSQSAVTETFYPVLGLHYIQAVEYASGSTAQIFGVNSSQQVMALTVSLDM